MIRFCFLLLLCYSVVCDDCVSYDFENGFDYLFSNNSGICQGLGPGWWTSDDYSSISIDSPHPNSNTFLFPATTLSCVSSFPFKMQANGIVEVNIYMGPAVLSDQLHVLVFQGTGNNNDGVVGTVFVSPAVPTFQSGWQTLRVPIPALQDFNGYITFIGNATSKSIVLIDSFRYLPPNTQNKTCKIYNDDQYTSATSIITSEATRTTAVTFTTFTTMAIEEESTPTIIGADSTTVATESTTESVSSTIDQETPLDIQETTPTIIGTKSTTIAIESTTELFSSTLNQETPFEIQETAATDIVTEPTAIGNMTTVVIESTTESVTSTIDQETPLEIQETTPTIIGTKSTTIAIESTTELFNSTINQETPTTPTIISTEPTTTSDATTVYIPSTTGAANTTLTQETSLETEGMPDVTRPNQWTTTTKSPSTTKPCKCKPPKKPQKCIRKNRS